jgi:hypothetical protein
MHQSNLIKTMSIGIIGIFLMTVLSHGIGAIDTDNEELDQNNMLVTSSTNSTELIDQSNGGAGCGGCEGASSLIISKGFNIAQSFIPSYSILSKATIIISKTGNPPVNMKLIFSIRESLYGDDLVSVEMDANSGFMVFDFEDIDVIPGDTYYMICQTNEVSSSSNGYSWYNTLEDHYTKGCTWISQNSGGWNENEEMDMFFETYWRDYGPGLPEIDGVYDGEAQVRYDYIFCATDPEEHDVYYFIEWGDGKTMRWVGPYESGEYITKAHQWALEGDYNIRVKAKDVYGVESDWQDFAISLPKQKQFKLPFLQFLEDHMYLFSLLQRLFGLS